MARATRRSTPYITVGRLMVVGGLACFGLIGFAALPACPMGMSVHPPVPPGCLRSDRSFLAAWNGMLVTPWAVRSYAVILCGMVSVIIGRLGESTLIGGDDPS